MSAQGPHYPGRRLLVPILVLAISLAITIAGAAYVASAANAKDRAHFESLVERNQQSIQRRLETYVNLLRGAGGLYVAEQNHVGVDQFHKYVDCLGLRQRYPGIQGIGAAAILREQDLAAAVKILAGQGIPGLHVYPPGSRDRYTPVLLLEPRDDRNKQALGFDMYTDPVRHAAMDKARDSGEAATSGKVTLVQEIDDNKQAGFLVYVPAYYTGDVPKDLETRRKMIGGFIFAPLRSNDFFEGIFGAEQFPSGISFAVYDGNAVAPEALLYESTDSNPSKARFAKTAALDVPGRRWTVRYTGGPQFEVNTARGFAFIVLAAGGVVSVVLFLLTASQSSARRRAEIAAADLRRGEQQILAAKQEVEQALAEAEEANELKDEFLATVSHELRTPLNAILGWTQLLIRHPQSHREELQHGLETIEKSARNQARLIEDLLDVSRIVAGKLRLDVHAVRLGPIIDAAIASVRLAADAKGVRIERSIHDNAGLVSGDPTRLQQIVWNLLSNAVKFTPSGGSVQIDLRQKEYQVLLIVRDTGIGISQEFLPHVFERFRQADASTTRRHGGLGLGLGIVRHLVELHGGTVRVESDGPDRGATFTVAFPVAAGHVDHSHSATQPQADSSLKGLRVLVVEDDGEAKELVTKMLRDRGASVSAASSVPEAMESLRSHRPDVIVSDIAMPDEDGYSLIRRVRSLSAEEGGQVPAIALSGFARSEDRQRSLSAGFQIHIAKPFDPDELADAIAGLNRK